jgi:hypothetical protein
MADIFGGLAAVYTEFHSMRKKFLLEALPYHYREALRPIPTNLMGTWIYRQTDAELTKELVENNKRHQEHMRLIHGNRQRPQSNNNNRQNIRHHPYNNQSGRSYNNYNSSSSGRSDERNNRSRDYKDPNQDFPKGN